jgi:hypothetical protein
MFEKVTKLLILCFLASLTFLNNFEDVQSKEIEEINNNGSLKIYSKKTSDDKMTSEIRDKLLKINDMFSQTNELEVLLDQIDTGKYEVFGWIEITDNLFLLKSTINDDPSDPLGEWMDLRLIEGPKVNMIGRINIDDDGFPSEIKFIKGKGSQEFIVVITETSDFSRYDRHFTTSALIYSSKNGNEFEGIKFQMTECCEKDPSQTEPTNYYLLEACFDIQLKEENKDKNIGPAWREECNIFFEDVNKDGYFDVKFEKIKEISKTIYEYKEGKTEYKLMDINTFVSLFNPNKMVFDYVLLVKD